MPPQKRSAEDSQQSGRKRVCRAITSSGQPCKRTAVPGLTVCKSHGGGTAASVRASKRASVSQQAAVLWGISSDTSGLSIEEELGKLARNKLTDITALRIKISSEAEGHIGLLADSEEVTEAEVGEEIYVTVKTKKSSGVSPWVTELHKAEQEFVAILRLLQEITGGNEEADTRRIRIQTAREAARLLKAFPSLTADEVAAEVSKRAS